MKKETILTLDELMSGLEKCVHGASLTGVLTTDVYNISGWLTPMLNNITNISKPHCFQVVKERGVAEVYYKMWSTTVVRYTNA